MCLGLPVIEQQLVCELHDTAPKLSRADDLASALGITNTDDVKRHLQTLRQHGLVESQEQRGSLLWTCSPVRDKGRLSIVVHSNCCIILVSNHFVQNVDPLKNYLVMSQNKVVVLFYCQTLVHVTQVCFVCHTVNQKFLYVEP